MSTNETTPPCRKVFYKFTGIDKTPYHPSLNFGAGGVFSYPILKQVSEKEFSNGSS